MFLSSLAMVLLISPYPRGTDRAPRGRLPMHILHADCVLVLRGLTPSVLKTLTGMPAFAVVSGCKASERESETALDTTDSTNITRDIL